ncbi:cytochrome P450 [Ustulina deusta]|nr:cytochrome P450 [Ustulina deusta]
MTDALSLLHGLPVLVGVGYLTYLILWRCFLCPLAKLPGPKLAALTYWYECYYDIARPAQYAFKIKALHRKYGPVVRIGPNDAPGPGHKRDKNSKHSRSLGINSSIGGSITHEIHRNRREALNPFFSPQRIHRLDPDLTSKAAQVEELFANARDSGQVLNLSDIYFAFCNDVVHKYCFGSDPNLLSNLHLASARRNNVVSVLGSVKIMFHFSWIRKLLQRLPGATGAHGMMIFRRRIRAQIDEVLARDPSLDKAPSIFTHLRDSTELPAAEKSAQRLEDEAVLMTMAGTYSPMLSLVVAHYHPLTRPDIMTKLRTELGAHGSIPAAAELERLPYLSAIAQEAHRLTFGLTGRNARVCPDKQIVYEHKKKPGQTSVFPPGTSLSVSTLVIHTDESLFPFPSPWVFDPVRWLPTTNTPDATDTSATKEQKEGQDAASLLVSRRRRSMLSFMRGPRVCIGRHLANAEIAVVLAVMARWDLELFETDEEDVQYKHDYHVMCPKLGSKGVRVKVKDTLFGTCAEKTSDLGIKMVVCLKATYRFLGERADLCYSLEVFVARICISCAIAVHL